MLSPRRLLLLAAFGLALAAAARVREQAVVAVDAEDRALARVGQVCSSTGDTHIQPWGASMHHIYSGQPFVAVEYTSANKRQNFIIHVIQKYGVWGPHSTNNDYAIRCGLDLVVITYPRSPVLPTVRVNGREVKPYELGTYQLPSAPEPRSAWTLTKGNMGVAELVLDCGFGQASAPVSAEYATGFKARMRWNNWNAGCLPGCAHGELHVEAAPRYQGKVKGACGWNPGGGQPGSNLITYPGSLFSTTPQDFAREAKEGAKLADPAHLAAQENSCRQKVEKATGLRMGAVQSWFKRVDRDIAKELNDYIKACAIDEYFGFPYDFSLVNRQVCGWVGMAKESLTAEQERAKLLITACAELLPDVVAMLKVFATEKLELSRLCVPAGQPLPTELEPLPEFPPCEAPIILNMDPPPPPPPEPEPEPEPPKPEPPKPEPAKEESEPAKEETEPELKPVVLEPPPKPAEVPVPPPVEPLVLPPGLPKPEAGPEPKPAPAEVNACDCAHTCPCQLQAPAPPPPAPYVPLRERAWVKHVLRPYKMPEVPADLRRLLYAPADPSALLPCDDPRNTPDRVIVPRVFERNPVGGKCPSKFEHAISQ